MKICVISGSHRVDSQSEKVAKYIINVEKKKNPAHQWELITLTNNPYPLFDEEFFDKNNERWKKIWSQTADTLNSSDGFIVISPEWSGIVPPGLKNFLLLSSGQYLAHKPGLIVGVSSTLGGSYPVNELRTSGYKNSRICYIPDHVIIRDCEKMLNGDTAADSKDQYIRSRLEYSVTVLLEYASALRQVRNSGVLNYKDFPYGM